MRCETPPGRAITQETRACADAERRRGPTIMMNPTMSPTTDPVVPTPTTTGTADHGSINSLRGLVCLGVIILHVHAFPEVELSDGPLGRFFEFVLAYGRLGVESFFVLAGYFLAHTFRPTAVGYLSVSRYVRRRFLRLAVPYWVFVLLLFLFRWAAHADANRSDPLPTPWQMASVFLFVQDVFVSRWFPYNTLWSMAPLFQAYLLWALVYWLVRRLALRFRRDRFQAVTQRAMLGLTAGALVASILAAGHVPKDGWQLPGWAWAFAAGALTYWRTRSLLGGAWYGAAIGSLVPIALVAHGPALPAAKVTVCCLLLLVLDRGWRLPEGTFTRALGFVGQRSYSLYLVHGPVAARVVVATPVALRTGGNQGLACLELLAASGVSVGIGFLFYHWVERPAARLAGQVEYRR